MGFFSGRVSFQRFRVSGRAPGQFGPKHIEALEQHAIGTQRVVTSDDVETGWIAGDHILDTRFDLAKNIIEDTLQFALRIDQMKIPSDLLRAYAQMEAAALAANNPSGLPSARQRRQARERAREKLEQEARDGRFVKRKAIHVLWDAPAHELLAGTVSATAVDRLATLFPETFHHKLEAVGAGARAFAIAEPHGLTRGVDDATPAQFQSGRPLSALSWDPDESSRNFLGNEFLLWLWYIVDAVSEAIELNDGSEATVMFSRSLVLECPRAETGKESIQSDVPTKLPEARRAIRSGKLPRKAGLLLVRHEETYELTLHAESLAVTGAKLPNPEEGVDRALLESRVHQLRHLVETLDLLFDAFCRRRLTAHWSKDLPAIQKWLQQEGRS